MLNTNLKIFLILIVIVYFLIIYFALKKKSISVGNSLLWLFFGFILILSIFCQPLLQKICNFIGIEKVSNFLLFCGFMSLLVLTFDLYKLNNELKQKLIKLGQEVAILKNERNNK